jgi:hypothetical protein
MRPTFHACLHTGFPATCAGALVACLVAGNHVSKAAVKMARMLVSESAKDSVSLGTSGGTLLVVCGMMQHHMPSRTQTC